MLLADDLFVLNTCSWSRLLLAETVTCRRLLSLMPRFSQFSTKYLSFDFKIFAIIIFTIGWVARQIWYKIISRFIQNFSSKSFGLSMVKHDLHVVGKWFEATKTWNIFPTSRYFQLHVSQIRWILHLRWFWFSIEGQINIEHTCSWIWKTWQKSEFDFGTSFYLAVDSVIFDN